MPQLAINFREVIADAKMFLLSGDDTDDRRTDDVDESGNEGRAAFA